LGTPRWLGGLSTKRRANGYSLGAATFGQGIGCMFTELLMMTGYTRRPGWLPHLRQSWEIGLGDWGAGWGTGGEEELQMLGHAVGRAQSHH